MRFFHDIYKLISIQSLPLKWRRIVFYSEGKTYWSYLNGIIFELLQIEDAPCITYITSGADDPGLALDHPRFRAFLLESDWARNWFFVNIDTAIMATTTPDLGLLPFRRSQRDVHYVYLPHSLVSLHMAYRAGAFDQFDTLFCAAPHHFEEARALEQLRGSKPKILVPHGYDRIDVMMDDLRGSTATSGCVLIAPSWGKHGLVETMGVDLVKILLDAGFQVILRPHPQTTRLHSDKIDAIESQFGAHERFRWDFEVGEWRSLAEADLMISDWSGVALEYAAVRRRPVLFINTPKKINNSEFELVKIPPVEVIQRERLGRVLQPENLGSLPSVVRDLLSAPDLSVDIIDLLVVNQGKAAKHGALYLTALAKGIS